MAGHVLRAMAHQAVDLGHPRRALNVAVASVEGRRYALASNRERALLGAVQARQGAMEEACTTWSDALDVMDGIHSARTRRTVADMRRALSTVRGRGIPAVAELERRATRYLAESA